MEEVLRDLPIFIAGLWPVFARYTVKLVTARLKSDVSRHWNGYSRVEVDFRKGTDLYKALFDSDFIPSSTASIKVHVHGKEDDPELVSHLKKELKFLKSHMEDSDFEIEFTDREENTAKNSAKSLEELIESPKNKLLFFGGKGGVGKTSISAATGLAYSNNATALVVTTDPAKALFRSFYGHDVTEQELSEKQRLVNKPEILASLFREIYGTEPPEDVVNISQLKGEELNKALADLKNKDFAEFAYSCSLLNRFVKVYDDNENLYACELGTKGDDAEALNSAGINELSSYLELCEYAALINRIKPENTKLIVDTAPTGHTLSLFNVPNFFTGLMKSFALKGSAEHKKNAEAVIEIIRKGKEVIQNPDASSFVTVAIPEHMSIIENENLVSLLNDFGIPVSNTIINRTIEESNSCRRCRKKKQQQEKTIDDFSEYKKNSDRVFFIKKVPAVYDVEITGRKGLQYLARTMYEHLCPDEWLSAEPKKQKQALKHDSASLEELASDPNKMIMFFGGKGGVGKTSISAATALSCSNEKNSYLTLAVTTDPAKALFRSFYGHDAEKKQLDEKDKLTGNTAFFCSLFSSIYSRTPDQQDIEEINKIFTGKSKNKKYDEFVQKLLVYRKFTKVYEDNGNLYACEIGTNFIQNGESHLSKELEQANSAGLNETSAYFQLCEFIKDVAQLNPSVLEQLGYKGVKIIIDTAPTGHTLAMFNSPNLYKKKFKKLAKHLQEGMELMQNRHVASFTTITIPEQMGIVENENLAKMLEKEGIPVNNTIINYCIDNAGSCPQCSAKKQMQDENISGFKPARALTIVPDIYETEIIGRKGLTELAKFLYPESWQ